VDALLNNPSVLVWRLGRDSGGGKLSFRETAIALWSNAARSASAAGFDDELSEITDDTVIADVRYYYKVELWTRDDQDERMLFAGTMPTFCATTARWTFAGRQLMSS
jgi:hypothetical protein